MNQRGDVLAFGAVAALAALGIAAQRGALPGRSRLRRSAPPGGRNIQVPLASLERPSSFDLAEMVVLDYSPTDFVRVYPDHARMVGPAVEVFTQDKGLVKIGP